MNKVWTGASMSLDGYIAGPQDTGFEHLFRWYNSGDVEIRTAQPEMTFHTTPQSAAHWHDIVDSTGALVVGRHLFDLTGGWGGTHPMGLPVVVMTHRPPRDWPRGRTPFTFVTEGIERAVEVASGLAGDKAVAVNAGTIARQCLDAGLLDEVGIDLVPVLLGAGTPFFGALGVAPKTFEGPVSAIQGDGVTHLRYRVPR
jgi:dihydrofolate reductase